MHTYIRYNHINTYKSNNMSGYPSEYVINVNTSCITLWSVVISTVISVVTSHGFIHHTPPDDIYNCSQRSVVTVRQNCPPLHLTC